MEHIPPGIYTVRARTWTFTESKKATFYLKMRFVIEGPSNAGSMVGGMLNFAADWQAERSDRVLRHLGWSTDERRDCHDNAGKLDTNSIQVDIDDETYNGHTRSTIKEFILPSNVDRAKLSKFLDNLKAPKPFRRYGNDNNIE